MSSLPAVLLVDDDQNLLVGLTRMLRAHFEVSVAVGGEEALALLSGEKRFAVVVSDMRMPGMDGVEVLAQARQLQPHATRLILSGHADLEAAARAVNEGNLFRFLFKPTLPPELISNIEAAVDQYRLVLAERELLEKTVTGSIEVLSEVLALTNPAAHGRARRVRRIVDALASELKIGNRWPLEIAASLSQVGAVLLPPPTTAKWAKGQPLSEAEEGMVNRMPAVADQLLKHIPRLEPVRAILAGLSCEASGQALEVRILRIALSLEQLLTHGALPNKALSMLEASALPGDALVLGACARLPGVVVGQGVSRSVTIENLREGMVLAADVRTSSGALLISRGHAVTFGLMTALRNYARTVGVAEPLTVEFAEPTARAA
jgi:CheY-like chemotaxis protein